MIRELFKEILDGWQQATTERFTNHPIAIKLRNELPKTFQASLGVDQTHYQIKASAGAGNWASVPWLSILDTKITSSTQEGVYPVYLLRTDGSGFYLSLGFGTTKLKERYGTSGSKEQAQKVSEFIHEIVPEIAKWGSKKIDLRANTDLGRSYEWASAGSKFYSAESLPTDSQILSDLNELLLIYAKLPSDVIERATLISEERTKLVETTPLPKPFMLLAGISGTGKTRFVRKQAEAHPLNGKNYCPVAVRPDWHEPSDLLGYVSRIGETKYVATKALKFIVEAWKAVAPNANEAGMGELNLESAPYWLCLDEMNLAPVEQYFADYLSVLESRKFENDEYHCEALLDKTTLEPVAGIQNELGLENEPNLWAFFREYGISLPPNLIVAGTVNMDETTHGFSRKVIDRAISIDFGKFFPNDYDTFFEGQAKPKTLTYSTQTHADKAALENTCDPEGEKTKSFLKSVNAILNNTPFELAYRALNELFLFVSAFAPKDEEGLQAVWDDFLMTKVLPRIDGDDDKLRSTSNDDHNNILDQLESLLSQELVAIWDKTRIDLLRSDNDGNDIKNIACRSREKIEWMKGRLEKSTFTSYWP